MGINVAIVGSTGILADTLRSLLEQRNFPVNTLRLIDKEEYLGPPIQFKGEVIFVESLQGVCFKGVDLVFLCSSTEVSQEYATLAVKDGAFVIDSTSAFRMEKGVPLIVPEINGHLISQETKMIASPNCTSVFLSLALFPLVQLGVLNRVVFSTYQAVSGGGSKGFSEMVDQVTDFFKAEELKAYVFNYPIAFNVIPQIGAPQDNGFYDEEMMMSLEAQKILGQEKLKVSGTCVRVPVLRAHSISVMIEMAEDLSIEQIKEAIGKTKGLILKDDCEEYIFPMPLDSTLQTDVFIGRLRKDHSDNRSILFWVVSDQLLKGTALNYIQIAEHVVAFIKEKN